MKKQDFLIKGISETIKNEIKEQKGVFLPILLETLIDSILGNASIGKEVIRADEGEVGADQNF